MDSEDEVAALNGEYTAEEDDFGGAKKGKKVSSRKEAKEHMNQLQRLQQKDPEFYKFLQENNKELLDFNDEGIDDDAETDMDDEETDMDDAETDMDDEEMHEDDDDDDETEGNEASKMAKSGKKENEASKKVITLAIVEKWCDAVLVDSKVGPIRSLLNAYKTACHYGDDSGDEPSGKFSTMSSSVFNKIMIFVLTEMDGILRRLLKFPLFEGKLETMKELMKTKQWRNYSHLMRSYLANSLHVLNQMTDKAMVVFTLRRIRCSAVFLAAFPSFLRRYTEVALHFWGTGGGGLPVSSYLFLRDLCVRLGSDSIDKCFRGMYKAYVSNCSHVKPENIQHIQFLANCLIQLLREDLSSAYQHAFLFIKQLAMLLRDALNMKTKEDLRKVCGWSFINCLELWTGAICTYSSEPDFSPLTYPLTQIITGVAQLVPSAEYAPLRLRCVRMLNRISASTGNFIPVAPLLLDMLEMKELHKTPEDKSKAIDMLTTLRVSEPRSRKFQEACVYSIVEELAEHFSQWSYSVSFFEASFYPLVRLRNFCKSTKVEKFRKEIRQLIRKIETNCEFTNNKRMSLSILPNDPAATSILKADKMSRPSPLSLYAASLRDRAQLRNDSLRESSVVVGAHSSVFGKKPLDSDDEDDTENVEGAAVFNSSWLPGSDSIEEQPKEEKKQKQEKGLFDEDVVQDFIPSSDEDEPEGDIETPLAEAQEKTMPLKNHSRKRKPPLKDFSKKKSQLRSKDSKKRRK